MRQIIAAAIAALPTIAGADAAGFAPFEAPAPHHGEQLSGGVWYPVADGAATAPVPYAANPVFAGIEVRPDAPLRPGAHPVVALSHGTRGEIRTLAWLAAGLAERGAVVVAVNHPNGTWRDFDEGAWLDHWTRAQDLSAALDALMADARFAGALDPSRVMAAGFSYGGWTALSLGGLRGNHAGYSAICAAPDPASHCALLGAVGPGLGGTDAAEWDAPRGDERVTHVAAIDPGLIWGLEAADAEDVRADILLIGLGDAETRLDATDLDAGNLLELLPGAERVQIAPALHFTAMPVCTPEGEAILIAEADDPVCTDPPGTDRAEVHGRIVDLIASRLGL